MASTLKRITGAIITAFFSAVFQDFSLLDATIAENIVQTDEETDMERMKDCIRQAGLEGIKSTDIRRKTNDP